MSLAANRLVLTLPALFSLLPPVEDAPEYDFVLAEEVPQPYHDLLVHQRHMTVTVEKHHGNLVDVKVLASRLDEDVYDRKILLTLQGSGRVVLFGIVRINLNYCSAPVRQEILAQKTPLGRILIQHKVLRRIEMIHYLRAIPSPAMMKWFRLKQPQYAYGRLALIHCDGQPAVELLEIVPPE